MDIHGDGSIAEALWPKMHRFPAKNQADVSCKKECVLPAQSSPSGYWLTVVPIVKLLKLK